MLMGVGIGMVVSLLVTRFMSRQFRGISPRNPLTLALVIAAIMTLGPLACCPRAGPPMVILRYE
jgi:hypothetical protein